MLGGVAGGLASKMKLNVCCLTVGADAFLLPVVDGFSTSSFDHHVAGRQHPA